ncbi:DUF3833 family protein [Sphingomonas yantingensis]|uniref:DUF3833 domain-containing protein n=1 Tax=Sphingomonas yantingensis TaxID=1241761 RepID=A0A7W9APC6_9SPHN|nr:hypothetical protein [Sphingomonas yantingensis]
MRLFLPMFRSPAAGPRFRVPASIVLAASVLGGCVPAGHLTTLRAPSPVFDPIVFFAGATRGDGVLKVLTRLREAITVAGRGTVTADGTIVLEQDVRRTRGRSKHRIWHLRRTAPGRYAGTLSDAAGPVVGEVAGNRLHLAFAMAGGLRAQQWLYLLPGGHVARNRMVVTKFGIAVASLDETIRRVPA